MSDSFSPINNISETAYLVAMYRAVETERPDALFQDPFARPLAGGRGEILMEVVGDKQYGANAIAVRTYVIEELIGQVIESKGIDTVLSLGAGLDTRPYRLSLPSSLRWIEVDLPTILSYKEEKLKNEQPICSLELVKLDLADIIARNALFSRVNMMAKQVLVITEGLLGYLPKQQVASLATDLYKQPNFRWWLFEMFSPFPRQSTSTHQPHKRFEQYFGAGMATMQFTPEEGAAFFWQYGWQVAELRSFWKESCRLKRGIRLMWLLQLLIPWLVKEPWETFCKRDGIVLLERI